MPHRTYSEREVTALLERAAELQAQAARQADGRPGLTLDELAAIADESGLDPALLRQAAAELDAPQGTPLVTPHAGTTSTHIYVERRVPGSLSPEAWEDTVMELRHRFDTDLGSAWGMPGYGQSIVEQIGRSVEWRHTSMSGIETRLMVRPRTDRLDVRLSQRVGWGSPVAESATYGSGLAALAAFIVGAATSSGLWVLATLLLTLAVAIPLILVADRAWRQKKHRELGALADRVATLLATPTEAAQAEAAGVSPTAHAAPEGPNPQGALDDALDGTSDDAPSAEQAARRRTHTSS